jgi:hypothetical protein
MLPAQEWSPGDRVILGGTPADLARLAGTHATVVGIDGIVATIRFDSPKLLGGRLRREIDLTAVWLLREPALAP